MLPVTVQDVVDGLAVLFVGLVLSLGSFRDAVEYPRIADGPTVCVLQFSSHDEPILTGQTTLDLRSLADAP